MHPIAQSTHFLFLLKTIKTDLAFNNHFESFLSIYPAFSIQLSKALFTYLISHSLEIALISI